MSCDKKDLLLYAVTDRSWLNGQTLYEQVEQALKGGVSFLQLREKELEEQAFLEEAKVIQELCKKYQVACMWAKVIWRRARPAKSWGRIGLSECLPGPWKKRWRLRGRGLIIWV